MDQWSLTGGTLEMKTYDQQCSDSIRRIVLSIGSSSRDFRAWTLRPSKNYTGNRTRWQGKDGSVPSKETERKKTTSGSPSLGSLYVENWGCCLPSRPSSDHSDPDTEPGAWLESQPPAGWNGATSGELLTPGHTSKLCVLFYRPWSTYPTLSHLILTTSLWDRYY